jgi:hypothetical protein
LKFAIYGPLEARFRALMMELGTEYSRSNPELTLQWLMDQHYGKVVLNEEDPRVDKILGLWAEIIVPVTTYPAPTKNDVLVRDILSCLDDIPEVEDWRAAFERMVSLRGMCSTSAFALPRLVAKREKGKLIYAVADGVYDSWTEPEKTTATLEQVLSGSDPGDWLHVPKAESPLVWKSIDQASKVFVHRLCTAEPHTAEWALRHMTPLQRREMRGLIDPLFSHPVVEYWQNQENAR